MTTSLTSSSSAEGANAAFAELGRILHGDQSLTQVLQRVAELTQQTIPELTEVSVTLMDNEQPRTVVFTGALAVDVDERQYETGFGPCTDAAASGNTIVVDTKDPDERYADFAALAGASGISHVLSVGLPIPQRLVGALNMYSNVTRPFAPASVSLAETFAEYAAIVLANAALYHDTFQLVGQMRAAMATRAVIEQAKGVLVAREHCTPDEPFMRLTRLSQRTNIKLRDVAARLVADAVGLDRNSAG